MPELLPMHLLIIGLGVFLVTRFMKELLFMRRDASGEPIVAPKPPPWEPFWRARRRLWIAIWSITVLGLPCIAFTTRLYPPLGNWVGLLWVPTVAVLLIRVGGFTCPRCGRNFSAVQKRLYHNAFTCRCLHCGLKAGTPGP